MCRTGEVFVQAAEVVEASGLCASSYGALSDADLLETQSDIAHLSAEVARQAALSAAELARRSQRSLGPDGLAARMGHATARDMVQKIMGGSRGETSTLLNAGLMLAQTEAADEAARVRETDPAAGVPAAAAVRPWFAPIGDAVSSGLLGIRVGEAIRAGLGAGPNGELFVSGARRAGPGFESAEEQAEREGAEECLRAAVGGALSELIAECAELTPEQAQKAARAARNRVDAGGLLARSEEMRRKQYFKVWTKPDGMVAGSFLLDPENGALVAAIHEQLRHPRRAGVKFRTPEEWAAERAAAGDLREIDEYTADAYVELLRAGVSVDPNKLLEYKQPAVRLVVTQAELDGRDARGTAGMGVIQRSNEAVPLEAVDRMVCTAGILPIRFDDNGESMNVGRTRRHFTTKQREALAVRDGGCMDPDCDKPISWTEAHHIEHWKRDRGRSDLTNGILLCRADHLRYHNLGYEIRRVSGDYWLIPPAQVDSAQTPRLMRAKSGLRLKSPVRLT